MNENDAGKKGIIETHRGGERYYSIVSSINIDFIGIETYQFCYFFRNDIPHSIVMKVGLCFINCEIDDDIYTNRRGHILRLRFSLSFLIIRVKEKHQPLISLPKNV